MANVVTVSYNITHYKLVPRVMDRSVASQLVPELHVRLTEDELMRVFKTSVERSPPLQNNSGVFVYKGMNAEIINGTAQLSLSGLGNVIVKGTDSPEVLANATSRALQTQVGGDHYKKMAIQPIEFSMANHLNACQHTILKYVTRYPDKNGVEDLKKARHTLDILIEFEESKLQVKDVTKVVPETEGST